MNAINILIFSCFQLCEELRSEEQQPSEQSTTGGVGDVSQQSEGLGEPSIDIIPSVENLVSWLSGEVVSLPPLDKPSEHADHTSNQLSKKDGVYEYARYGAETTLNEHANGYTVVIGTFSYFIIFQGWQGSQSSVSFTWSI